MGLTGPDFIDSKHKENVSIFHTSILRNSRDKVIVQPSLLRCQDIIACFSEKKWLDFLVSAPQFRTANRRLWHLLVASAALSEHEAKSGKSVKIGKTVTFDMIGGT